MDSLAADIVALLKYLLPGLLCAWVFYGLTAFQKPSQFERIVQALIFTLIVQALVSLYEKTILYLGNFISVGPWDPDIELTISVCISIVLGVLFSYFTNNGKFHSLCRRLKITKENPYRSEWIHEFINRETHIILHLNDGRRICGWPDGWPPTSNTGHFSLSDAAWWYTTEKDEYKEQVLDKTEVILINSKDVLMVEFLQRNTERKKNEQ